jgi:hypothetical protein
MDGRLGWKEPGATPPLPEDLKKRYLEALEKAFQEGREMGRLEGAEAMLDWLDPEDQPRSAKKVGQRVIIENHIRRRTATQEATGKRLGVKQPTVSGKVIMQMSENTRVLRVEPELQVLKTDNSRIGR